MAEILVKKPTVYKAVEFVHKKGVMLANKTLEMERFIKPAVLLLALTFGISTVLEYYNVNLIDAAQALGIDFHSLHRLGKIFQHDQIHLRGIVPWADANNPDNYVSYNLPAGCEPQLDGTGWQQHTVTVSQMGFPSSDPSKRWIHDMAQVCDVTSGNSASVPVDVLPSGAVIFQDTGAILSPPPMP